MRGSFSIITPTYQNPEELKTFLTSLENAIKPADFEILIMDDSLDNKNKKISESFQRKLPLKFFKFPKHLFISQKRNIGALKAKNEIIFFIDSDIQLDRNSISILWQTMKEYPEAALFGGKIIQDKKQFHPTRHDRLLPKGDIVYCEVIYSAYLSLYKSIFLKLGGYDEIFGNRGEGTDLSIRFWRAGFPIVRNLNSVVSHPSFKPQRKSPTKIAEMYRSLFLVGYKYGLDPQKNPHFIEMYQERKDAYGETCEYFAIYSAVSYLDWFVKNYHQICKSQKNAPGLYDFKPFDIFTDKKLLNDCLNQAKERITPFYHKAFN